MLATNDMFCDPAIDASEAADADVPGPDERLAEYRKTRDPKALVLKSEQKPTWFVCKPLSPTSAVGLDGFTLLGARRMAFVLGCHEVRLPNGDVMKPKKLKAGPGGTALPADENAWVDEIGRRFGLETIYEIGSVIYERARLPESARGPFSYRAG